MGMFDRVHTTAMQCPLCGNPLGWQTKDADNILADLTVPELMQHSDEVTFYAGCDGCRAWIDVKVRRDQNQETSAQQVHRLVNEHVLRREIRR